MEIKPLSPTYINNNMAAIVRELRRADDDSLKVDDILDDLTTGTYDLYGCFVEDKAKYYMLCTVVGSTYFIIRVAGEGKHFPWAEFKETLSMIAKYKDCTSLSFHGEKYWEDKVSDLGFEVTEYIYKLVI